MAEPITVVKTAQTARVVAHHRHDLLGLLLALFGLFALLVILLPAVLVSALSQITLTKPEVEPPPGRAIPADVWQLHAPLAEAFAINPYLLASIHKQESDFGRSTAPGVRSGVNSFGCCAGPMQFNLNGTWGAYKGTIRRPTPKHPKRRVEQLRPTSYPNQRGTADLPSCDDVPRTEGCVYDNFDAVASAAAKLRADGADTSLDSAGTRRAVCAYIGACKAVESCGGPNAYCQVLPRAKQWQVAANAADAQSATLAWPVPTAHRRVTSPFGVRSHPIDRVRKMHEGVDFGVPSGVTVTSAGAGRVSFAGRLSGYGNYVCVDHDQLGVTTCYAHLGEIRPNVNVGMRVGRGHPLGVSGNTGSSTAPHLHFEVRRGGHRGAPVDPMPFLGSA